MKIGRNEPCPCGSGKNYKKCCLDKSEEDRYMESLFEASSSLKRDARIKQCLHPNKSECASNIIKAHAIQNNRILSKLAVGGCVISMDGTSNMIFQDAQSRGRKIATTFTGFCSYHDKTLFQEIEDVEFIGTEKQVFLWTYRTLAWHYHKKQEQINSALVLKNKMLQKGYAKRGNKKYTDLMKGARLAEKDNSVEKEIFDNHLLSEDFKGISYVIWELPYEIQFAISMMHGLEHDIKGKKTNNYFEDVPIRTIYLNIFPSTNKSFCIWSWQKDNDDIYSLFAMQFMELELKDKINYLNNKMPRWSDSIIISPRLWNKWGDGIQQALISHANFEFLYRMYEEEEKKFSYEYMDTPWDFFEEPNKHNEEEL